MAEAPKPIFEDIPAERTRKTVDTVVDVLNPFPPVEVILLDKEKYLTWAGEGAPKECPSQRLPGFSFRARPAATPAGREVRGLTDTAKIKPSVVFLPDERYTYADSSFPWSTVGKFSRLDRPTEAFDYAVLVLHDTINDKVGGYAGARMYDAAWNGQALWQTLGYPADLNNAERPTFQRDCVISSREDFSFPTGRGPGGFVLGHFNDTFSGMSGGPNWGTWPNDPGPSVVGVNSTSPTVPQIGSTTGDEYGGGTAMVELVKWARSNGP